MARNRTISPDFWTSEAVIDCAPMTRLLFLGLWNFADDLGVQPLRPRTIRLQVFPGDDIDAEAVRAMIEELAAQGLVRLYEVEGQDYVEIVDWDQLQRVGKRARRRYPSRREDGKTVPGVGGADEAPLETIANHGIGEAPPSPLSALRAAPDMGGEKDGEPERWRRKIKDLLGLHWPHHARIGTMDDRDADRWTAKWIAQGCDFGSDVLPAVRDFCVAVQFSIPPASLGQLDEGVTRYRIRREARERPRIAA